MFSNRLSVIARGLRCVLGGLAFAPLTLHRIGRVPSLGEERIMPDWKRIRQAVWHPTVAHLREAQDEDGYHPCSCAPASAGGNSCSTLECVNRGCQMECVPSLCPCGEECTNQEIQRQALPNVEIRKMGGAKGMGAIALAPIESDKLVCEYIGEVIDQNELYRRRRHEYKNMRHTYIMTYIKGLLIDATQKGNWARYLNHSCNPNCSTQKWIVAGRTRVGIFTKRRCEPGEELTYDYNLEWNGFARVKCECKAANCSGWLGGRNDNMQSQLVLHDSDDDAGSDAEDGEAVTKVTPLSMLGTTSSSHRKDTAAGHSGQLRPSPAGGTQSVNAGRCVERDAQRDAQKQAADEMAALEEQSVADTLRKCIYEAEHKYPTVYGSSEMAQRLDWGPVHDDIEKAWEEQYSTVKRLLEGMQHVTVKRRVRMKPAGAGTRVA